MGSITGLVSINSFVLFVFILVEIRSRGRFDAVQAGVCELPLWRDISLIS